MTLRLRHASLVLTVFLGLATGCGQGQAPRLVKVMPCGSPPEYLALSPDRGRLAAVFPGKRELWLYRLDQEDAGPQVIRLGKNPGGVLFSGDGKKIYACETGLDSIAQVSLKEARVVRRIKTGAAPSQIAFSEDESRFYICCQGSPGLYDAPGTPPCLSIFRVQDLRHEKDLDLGGAASGLCVLKRRGQAYAAIREAGVLAILYLPDRSLQACVQVSANPEAVAASRDGNFAYVACAGRPPQMEEGEGSGDLEAESATAAAAVESAEEAPPRASWQGAVCLVRLRDRQVVDTIVVGAGACDLEQSPSGSYLYVICRDQGTLEILSTRLQERVCRFGLPGKPGRIVLDEGRMAAYITLPRKKAIAVVDVSMFP